MSLDLSLIKRQSEFDVNITHNLADMARACGLYEPMWNSGGKQAFEVESALTIGCYELRRNRGKYEAMNPENGWGSYENLLQSAELFLEACKRCPNAYLEVSK